MLEMFAVVWKAQGMCCHCTLVDREHSFRGFSSLTCQELFQVPERRDTARLKKNKKKKDFFFPHAVRISIVSHDGVEVLVYFDAIKHVERETAERFKYIHIHILLMLHFFFLLYL